MGPTRKRDLMAAVLGTAAVGYLLIVVLYQWFPPITVWTGLSLLAVGVAEAVWGVGLGRRVGVGLVGRGLGVPVAAAVMAAGGWRRHRRHGGRGRQRAGSGGCCAVAATLL